MDQGNELMGSEELLEVYNFSKTATAIHCGEDAVIQSANHAMLRIWGKDRSVIGKTLLQALPELKGQPYAEMFKKAWLEGKTFSGEGSPAELEIGGKIKTYYFDYEFLPVFNANGEVIAVMNSAIDVTDRVLKEKAVENARETNRMYLELKQARAELKELNTELENRVNQRLQELSESEERFTLMAENTELLISVGDQDNKRIYFNKQWERVTGLKVEELMKKGWVDLIHPDEKDAFIKGYYNSFEKKEIYTAEFRLPVSDGNYRWYHCQSPPRFLQDGTFAGYIASCLDITIRKNEELRKNEFISMISHELKTPLTSLNGFIQVMKSKLKNLDKNYIENALNKSQIQINKMSAMISGFLDISRLESGKMQFNAETFPLDEALRETVEELSMIHSSHKIELADTCMLNVHADHNKISAVVSNLVSNAIKYTPYGSTITITCRPSEQGIQVCVEDQGSGIERGELENIFQRYYRTKDNSTISGFGIGLYLCSEIITRQGGKIWAESSPGEGAKFFFALTES